MTASAIRKTSKSSASRRARTKQPPARTTRGRRPTRSQLPRAVAARIDAASLFPGLCRASSKPRQGVATLIAAAFRQGDHIEWHEIRGCTMGRTIHPINEPIALARLFDGLANGDRIRVLEALCRGASDHRGLRDATDLKAGPLYFHLRQLERAGLLAISGRNSYEPTALGRTALAVALALHGLAVNGKPSGTWRRTRRNHRIRPHSVDRVP